MESPKKTNRRDLIPWDRGVRVDSTNSHFPRVFPAVLNQIFFLDFSALLDQNSFKFLLIPLATDGARPECPPQGHSQAAASDKRIQLIN